MMMIFILGNLKIWYFLNSNIFKPNRLNLIKKIPIESIACGNKFCLILSGQGIVYSFGKNKFGELGTGDKVGRENPEPIYYLIDIGEKITQISCGFKHSVAKGSLGKVYSWGLNATGQLGHGNFLDSIIPKIINFEVNKQFKTKTFQISCSYRGTLFLTENREVLVCGTFNDYFKESLPVKFNLSKKHPEILDKSSYSAVKIVCSWNQSFSIFYSIIADISCIYKKNKDIKKNKYNAQLSCA